MQSLLYAFSVALTAALLLLPPVLMTVRFARPKWMPVWAMLAFHFPGGWVLVNAGVHTYQAYLDLVVMNMPNPDEDDPIVRAWMHDGARMVFALVFGWLYAPAIWVLWSPAFAIVWLTRVAVRRLKVPVHSDVDR